MHCLMRDGFIARQSMNIEQTHSMSCAQLLKDRADNWMPGCLWIIQNKTNVHRLAASRSVHSYNTSWNTTRRPFSNHCTIERYPIPTVTGARAAIHQSAQSLPHARPWPSDFDPGFAAAVRLGTFGNVEDIV